MASNYTLDAEFCLGCGNVSLFLGFVSLMAVYIFLFFRSAIDSVFGDLFSVSNYTREAGVRSLERKIGGVCRAVAVQVLI